jgi:hypothetical protein
MYEHYIRAETVLLNDRHHRSVANLIKVSTGSWHLVFLLTAIMNIAVVAIALFIRIAALRKSGHSPP